MYVIYLNSEPKHSMRANQYGYWTGKSYVADGTYFPITEESKEGNVKVYKNKKVAEKSAEKARLQFGGVSTATVEEY